MNCDRIKDRFADYLTGDIDPAAEAELRAHIAACAPCRAELESLSALWAKLGVLPREQPSGRLRAGFYAMLEDYKRDLDREAAGSRETGRTKPFLQELFSFRKPAYAFSLALALLVVGIGTGYFLRAGGGQKEIAALHREVSDMRQTVALNMLDRPSATDRLEAVGWSSKVDDPDERTLRALVDTLNNDPNVNVRLAAVDALYLFRSHPLVKDSLIRALAAQDSPLVQVALIDLLVEIREGRAVEALKNLIQNARLNPEVRKHAELGLKQII
jgi:hypothetical protein